MSNMYVDEYLRLVQASIDPEASIDEDGNVVFVEQTILEPLTEYKAVSPEECEKAIKEMYGSI